MGNKKVTIESENKQRIEKFFFGEMTEEERFKFEEMFITDADLLAEVKAFEDDLIEKYIRDWMTSEDKLKFETHFLNTKKRLEKVEFSRSLIEELHQTSIPQIEEKESIWEKLQNSFSFPQLAVSVVFAILLLVFGSWFLLRHTEPKEFEIVKNQPPANTQIPNNEIVNSNKNVETNSEVSDFNSNANIEIKTPNIAVNSQNLVNTPKPKITPKKETDKKISNPVLALYAGTLRSDGKIKELKFPQNSNGVNLQLNLKSVDYKQFQADLIDGNGNIIFQNKNLKSQKSRLNLFISKEKLKKGDYRISLYGKTTSGENESVADYQFRVN